MIQRIGKRKFNIYAFDIESHNDYKSLKKRETSMWLGCFINENSDARMRNSYVFSMTEFLNKLKELSSLKRKNGSQTRPCKNLCIYIWNLSFEWSFILPVLIQQFNFKWKETIEKDDEYVFNSVSTKSVSSVWLIQMKFAKNDGLIIFRDLNKIFTGSLSSVAKAFNLPTQKGSINYRKYRLQQNYRCTAKELYYCFCDTRIIIDILLKLKDDKIFWNASSMASYSMKKLLKTGFPRALKPYAEYRKLYPNLCAEESEFLRKSVSGGITYAPSRWQFKDIKQKILHIDKHQMHPSSAYFNLFPYGHGEYFQGRPPIRCSSIACCRIRISYTGVKLHSIIKLIGDDIESGIEIVVWDFEIPTMKKVYEDLTIEYIDGYIYKAKPLPWRKYYANNYNLRLEAKKNKDEFLILYYKLLNNSSYGKHLEKPHNQFFQNMIGLDGCIDSLIIDKNEFDIQIDAKYTYLPIGSCIPAYSRVDLIESALLFDYQDVVYFDTDSIFVLATKHNMEVWENQFDKTDFLGGWGFEEFINEAEFSAPKRYKLLVDSIDEDGKQKDKLVLKMAGINGKYIMDKKEIEMSKIHQVPFEEINIDKSSWKIQRAFRCKGGTLIDIQQKNVSVQMKYQAIYDANVDK